MTPHHGRPIRVRSTDEDRGGEGTCTVCGKRVEMVTVVPVDAVPGVGGWPSRAAQFWRHGRTQRTKGWL